MNALQMARTAYSSTTAPIRTPRDTEYDAIARITHRLREAVRQKDSAFPAFVEALHENRRLWTLLAANVAEADNQLPQELRAQIFYLGRFVIQHTSEVLSNAADETALIDINTAIMRGLKQGAT